MRIAILLAVLMAVLSPIGAPAQDAGKIPRLGLLSPHKAESEAAANIGTAAFRNGLRALGYLEGQTVVLAIRHTGGDLARLQSEADALVAEKVDLIAAVGTDATRAAQRATATVPIVMIGVGDPIAAGFVASLARPGGNITGTALLAPDLFDKQLALLKEAVPHIRTAGILCKARHARSLEGLQKVATAMGISIVPVCPRSPDEVPEALERLRRAGIDSYITLSDPMLDDMHGTCTVRLPHSDPAMACPASRISLSSSNPACCSAMERSSRTSRRGRRSMWTAS
jgi:putative ABC transport system substrate-binding protein